MSRWSTETARAPMGRQRGYGSEYGSSYDASLDGARIRTGGLMRGLGSIAGGAFGALSPGALGSGIRSVGMGQAATTYGADPWGSGGTYAGRRALGQATDGGTIAPAVDAATGAVVSTLNTTGQALVQVTAGVGVMAALGAGLSGAASGALVGAVAGGRGSRTKYAGRGALAGAAIANVGATIVGGLAWAGADRMAAPGSTEVELVRSGAMTFTLANAALAAIEIAAIVLTGAAR